MICLGGCHAGPVATPTPGKREVVVQVAHPVERLLGTHTAYTGSLESPNQAAVAPEVSGLLKAVKVMVGDRVRQGQVLAIVDDSQLTAQVSQAQSSLLAAQSGVQTAISNEGSSRDQVLTAEQNVQTATAELANAVAAQSKAVSQSGLARRNYGRTNAVYKQDLISAQSLDQALVQLESARADVVSARSKVKASEGQVAQAKAQVRVAMDQSKTARSQVSTARAQAGSLQAALSSAVIRKGYATVLSPIDGVVLSRSLDPGVAVTPSTPILVVASTRHLRVAIAVDESDLSSIREGQKMSVEVDAYPDRVFPATVKNLSGGLDPATRTMRAELQVDDVGHRLRPGMSARVESLGVQSRGLVVPLSAVFSKNENPSVWVVDESHLPHRKLVKLLKIQDGDAVLAAGPVRATDLVVTSGVDQVSENVTVKSVLSASGRS
jgi:RND family efflux transporter MFP subunit